MTSYAEQMNLGSTPQDEKILGSTQVPNSAGGYVWPVDDWTRLQRFLILGSDQGSCHIAPRPLSIENAEAVLRCIAADGPRVVREIVEISTAGRAAKNDPAVFTLMLAASRGNDETRKAAFDALNRVARFATPLFQFCEEMEKSGARGWGRGARRGVGSFYTMKDVDRLAYQLVKYRQRNGWTHRDVLRLAHPKAPTPAHQALFHWATRNEVMEGLPEIVHTFLKLQEAKSAADVLALIKAQPDSEGKPGIAWEMIPTQFLGDPKVWEALLPNLGPTALVRNLARLTANGLIAPMSDVAKFVAKQLRDVKYIQHKPPIHPVAVLLALVTYQHGHGERGKLSWNPNPQVLDALNEAFHLAFGNVEPCGKNLMLCLDLSGSMSHNFIQRYNSKGEAEDTPLSARMAAAAMAIVTAATEPNYVITGFTAHGDDTVRFSGQSGEDLELAVSTLPISPRQRLDDVMKLIETYSRGGGHGGSYRFAGTDCSLPMRYALERKIPVHEFVVYTDSQTWAGEIHPSQALQEYRQKMGIPAKLVVVGMVSNGFTIADPNDAGMLDVVGFDTATPNLISDFAK